MFQNEKFNSKLTLSWKKHHEVLWGTCGFHHLVGGFKHYLMVTPSWGNDLIWRAYSSIRLKPHVFNWKREDDGWNLARWSKKEQDTQGLNRDTPENYFPWNEHWPLKMDPWKRRFRLETSISRGELFVLGSVTKMKYGDGLSEKLWKASFSGFVCVDFWG